MQQYLELLHLIMTTGEDTTDRTGTGTRSIFGHQMRFDLRNGQVPIMTTKRIPFRVIVEELLWFLRGDTQLRSLLQVNVHIWDEWPFKWYLISQGLEVPKTDSPEWSEGLKEFTNRILVDDEFNEKYGDLGPVYGKQWRAWPGAKRNIDQMQIALDTLRNAPDSRRIIVSAWNPDQIDEMAKAGLPPCHCLFQFKAINGKLSCMLNQRSCDTFLGVPFNILSYALLTVMVARATGLTPHEFIWTGGDVHIYQNHFKQVALQLSRTPKKLPTLRFTDDAPTDLFAFKREHFILEGYDPDPTIEAPIAV